MCNAVREHADSVQISRAFLLMALPLPGSRPGFRQQGVLGTLISFGRASTLLCHDLDPLGGHWSYVMKDSCVALPTESSASG